MWEVMSYGERPYWNWSNQDVIKAIEKVIHIGDKYPMVESPCYCDPDNASLASRAGWILNKSLISPLPDRHESHVCELSLETGGVVTNIPGHTSVGCYYVPNAFLMSILIFIGTYLISSNLIYF